MHFTLRTLTILYLEPHQASEWHTLYGTRHPFLILIILFMKAGLYHSFKGKIVQSALG